MLFDTIITPTTSASLSFKYSFLICLDKLEALTGQSKFIYWYMTIKWVLKMQKLLDFTTIKQTEPTDAGEKLTFELKNIEAILIMQQLITTDLQWVI